MRLSRTPRFYKLDGRRVVPVEDLLQWAVWLEGADWVVAVDAVGPVLVSTVFLGVDHRLIGPGPPLVFETMIRGGEPQIMRGMSGKDYLVDTTLDYPHQERYSTWAEAEAGHAQAVEWAGAWLGQIAATLKAELAGE